MAIENQAAVRGTHRTHHHSAGASKAAAGDDTGAAGGFSALLGAAADDTDGLDAGLAATAAGLQGDTLAGTGSKPAPAGDSAGSDAAALAAWAGLLQPAAVPLAPVAATAVATAAAGPSGTAVPGDAGTPGGQAAGAAGLPGMALPGSAAQGAGLKNQAGALLQVDGKAAGRSATPDAAASLNTLPTTVSPDSLANVTTSGAVSAPNPAAAPMAGNHLAAGSPLRPAAVSVQAAVGRAHAATVAADAASSQFAGLSAGAGAITVGATDPATGRGAASTVSMGEGGQGRWAGVLSDIVRPIQAEGGTGGFAGGASQGQERGHQGESRGADGSATGVNALGFAPAAAGAEGTGSFAAASTFGTDGQPIAAGMVMTPDEWLAATTASINPRSLQTAEMTVDAFGAPVDVKISLNGSEAEVAFQSDQADTRALLGGAVSDLQNLLQQEGLLLAGVSVGGSNAGLAGQGGNAPGFNGDASQGGSRARGGEPMRITPDISTATPVAVAAARSAAATARGGLDLFA